MEARLKRNIECFVMKLSVRCWSLFLIKLQALACNFTKKETIAQVFFCDFCEIFKNTFFTDHLRANALLFDGFRNVLRISP